MIRILNVEPENYSQIARDVLVEIGELSEIQLSRQQIKEQIADYDVLIVRLNHQIDREILLNATRLKAIVSATTGLDHIDITTAKQHGIEVLSLRGERDFLDGIRATPEHTWAILLALFRQIPAASAHVINGGWDRDMFRGYELDGKRLGILGLGRVGRIIAQYAQAFNMRVSAYDPYYVGAWPDYVIRYDELSTFANNIDILSIHLPLNNETQGFVDKTLLSQLPKGSYVVNTARGAIVDEVALIHQLEIGHIAGAALDVIEHERDIQQRQHNALTQYAVTHPNLLITPHIAGATYESMMKTELFMATKLKRYLQAQELIN